MQCANKILAKICIFFYWDWAPLQAAHMEGVMEKK